MGGTMSALETKELRFPLARQVWGHYDEGSLDPDLARDLLLLRIELGFRGLVITIHEPKCDGCFPVPDLVSEDTSPDTMRSSRPAFHSPSEGPEDSFRHFLLDERFGVH